MPVQISERWLQQSNAEVFDHIGRQGRSSMGLMPFIGAGLSTSFGMKDWRSLLLGAAPPRLSKRVEKLLNANRYQDAAEILLGALGPDGFQNMVAASANDSRLSSFDFTTGTVALLPLLNDGPVVTTNFDRVLERAFQANGAPFEAVISGPRPDLIIDALHGNRRVLVKLHGDWQDRVGRTFAKSDYEANYGEAQPEKKRELLEGSERLIFAARSLLFLGASLGPDRTVQVLQEVYHSYAGIRHFAVMSVPRAQKDFDRREQHLRGCGVLPIWYVAETPQDHAAAVEALVAKIVERMSVETVAPPNRSRRHEARAIGKAAGRAVRPAIAPAPDVHLDRMVRLVEDGRLNFFLGSAIHYPTKLMAREFYEELASIFECTSLIEERFAVAQYIADRHGRDTLNAEIRALFARTKLVPRETHRMFSAWRELRTRSGRPMPYPTIFTTNYDDLLERSLDDADLPYHLLSYQVDGPRRGLFYHQCENNGLTVIEKPSHVRKLSDAFVVVKLNGGIDHRQRIRECYATTRLDYWALAAAIPSVLPAVIQRRLLANPLLFLGHGLAAPDIEAVVRFAHRDSAGPRSWAVVKKRDGIEYWRQCGVEILDRDVGEYVRALHERLTRNGP